MVSIDTEAMSCLFRITDLLLVTKDNLGKIRAKNYAGDDEEWHSIIAWIFLRKRVDGRLAGALRGLETVATIEGNLLTITLRKTISGITQRLGTIGLHQDEAQAIELFEWAGIAAAATTALETEVATLSAKYQDQQKALIKLSSQLKDLTKTKEEHENVLLEKFMELLNAKKLKIRDQQRLLAGAKVDPDKGKLEYVTVGKNLICYIADRVQDARSSRAPREVAPSRTSKRKARAKPVAASSASDGDDFETMDISMEKNAGVQLDNEEQVSTPDKSDLDATEDEDEAVDTVANAPMTQSGIGSKGKVMDVAKKEDEASSKSKRASPPPRRELPFSQAGTAKGPRTEDLPHTSRAKPEGNTDDEETEGETDDDEL